MRSVRSGREIRRSIIDVADIRRRVDRDSGGRNEIYVHIANGRSGRI